MRKALKGQKITGYRLEIEKVHPFNYGEGEKNPGLEFKHGLVLSSGRTAWFQSVDQDIRLSDTLKRDISGLGDIVDQYDELKLGVKHVPCWQAHKRECCAYDPLEIWKGPLYSDNSDPERIVDPKTLIGRTFVSSYNLRTGQMDHGTSTNPWNFGMKLDDGTIIFAFDGDERVGLIVVE